MRFQDWIYLLSKKHKKTQEQREYFSHKQEENKMYRNIYNLNLSQFCRVKEVALASRMMMIKKMDQTIKLDFK